VKTDLRNWFR